ncbi:MAG: protein kinase [Planctomycetaceae bacterium]
MTAPSDDSNSEIDSGQVKGADSSEEATVIGSHPTADQHQLDVTSAVPPIKRMGKYAIGEEIGRGGMGVVWKAFDPDLQRTVAVKELAAHLAQNSTSRRRFRREARAAAAINHPNVLTIHAVEEDHGVPFLVMEYVSGKSLKEYVAEKGKVDFVEFIHLSCQTAQGLAAAHAQGVIHRDVKPGNVMLDEGATRVSLTDFGLARVTYDNQELTSNDQCVGTPSYMSPETLRGDHIDARSDLFSLGCVFYRMLSGYSPFQGRTQGEVIHRILDSNPRRLDEVDPSIPPVLADLVHRLLQKNPDERYQSAAEVADILARLQSQINQANTDEIGNVLAFARTTPKPTSTPAGPPVWLLPIVVAVTAVSLIGGLFWFFPSGPVEPTVPAAPAMTNPAPGSPGVVSNAEAPPVQPVEKLMQITVGATPAADFPTISEAVRHAETGATINVIGPGPFVDEVKIEGSALNGLSLIASAAAKWQCNGDQRCLSISDVTDIRIQGFDFEIAAPAGRAIDLSGDTRNVHIEDCSFRHSATDHKLSLVLVATHPLDAESAVTISRCRFRANGSIAKCLTFGSDGSAARVVCEHCIFEATDTHLYLDDGCRHLNLRHNIFVGGSTGINFGLKAWWPDSDISVVNNTFAGQQYWLSLGDSFKSGTLPSERTDSLVCNNLILGGQRTLGNDKQWDVAINAWQYSRNWWERDDTTRDTAGRDGRVAELHDRFDIPNRTDIESAEFMVPNAGSPLLRSGVGTNGLPDYIGAKSRE